MEYYAYSLLCGQGVTQHMEPEGGQSSSHLSPATKSCLFV
jgi:hypothetical protein